MIIWQLIDEIKQNGRLGLLYVVAFLFAIMFALVLHEVAHGLVALWNGDKTAKLYGRLTLNPVKHFDWIGLLMMLVVGFGWARPVPVDSRNFKKYKTGCITVSLAGITVNILLAFLFAMLAVILENVRFTPDTSESVFYLVYFFYFFAILMVQINISFALFNLLPLYPLDGYRFLACFVNENNGFMSFLRKYSLYIMLGFILLENIPVIGAYTPFNLYIGVVGGWIRQGFTAFWRLIF